MFSIVGKKVGMSRIYNDKGILTPITLIQLYDCCVSEINSIDGKNYNNIVLSYDKPKNPDKKLTKPIIGYYNKKNLEPYSKKCTVKISKDKSFNIGDILKSDLLSNVDLVDVTAISKGKGFAGGMKRWGFHGLEAQHGVSISHRSLGSTGNRMSPAKVFKGKKMPGQMGNKKVTVKNLKVVEINNEGNFICLKGAVPGFNGTDVLIKIVKEKK